MINKKIIIAVTSVCVIAIVSIAMLTSSTPGQVEVALPKHVIALGDNYDIACMSGNGKYVAMGRITWFGADDDNGQNDIKNNILVKDIVNNKIVFNKVLNEQFSSMALTDDGSVLAVKFDLAKTIHDSDGEIVLYDIKSGNTLKVIKCYMYGDLYFTKDQLLGIGSYNLSSKVRWSEVKLVNSKNMKMIIDIKDKHYSSPIKFTGDGKYLALSSIDNYITLIDVATAKTFKQIDLSGIRNKDDYSPPDIYDISYDNKYIGIRSESSNGGFCVDILNIDTNKLKLKINDIDSFAFHPKKNILAIGRCNSKNYEIQYINIPNGDLIDKVEIQRNKRKYMSNTNTLSRFDNTGSKLLCLYFGDILILNN